MVQDGFNGFGRSKYMRLVFPTPEQNVLLAAMAGKELDVDFNPCQCLAFMQDDKIAGVVVYFNFRWPSIEAAFYCHDYRWALNRQMVADALAYPFVQLGCKRITAIVEKHNKRSRMMCRRLGFVEEGKLRKAGEKGDLLIYGMLPDEYRLKPHGQKVSTQSAAAA